MKFACNDDSNAVVSVQIDNVLKIVREYDDRIFDWRKCSFSDGVCFRTAVTKTFCCCTPNLEKLTKIKLKLN